MESAEPLGSALAGSSDRQLVSALARLPRIVADRPEAADAVRSALDEQLPQLVERSDGSPVEVLDGLATLIRALRPQVGAAVAVARLPPITSRTARMAGELLRTAIVPLTALAETDGSVLPELAHAYDCLNIVFSHLGRADDSVAAGRRAVEGHRTLVEREGNRRVAGLACALNNLAVAHMNRAETETALRCGEEAVALHRRLRHPVHRRGLVNALTNHAIAVADSGRRAEGLDCMVEAVQLCRIMVADGDAAATRDLVHGLNNLSAQLAEVGRDHEALAAVEEAVRICRRLAESDRSALADLARSLNGQSERLAAVGRHGEGLTAIREAVRLRRSLVGESEDHRPDLAQSLTNLSARLTQFGGEGAERLVASAEAATTRRRLARGQPAQHNPSLAIALHNLSIDLGSTGDEARALAAAEEAVAIRRALTADNGEAHGPGLARSLRNLSLRLAATGRPADAARAADESVEVLRRNAAARPELRAELAEVLHNAAVRLDLATRHTEARTAVDEAIGIRRALPADDPAAHLPGLAASLNSLSVSLTGSGQLPEALAASQEAVSIRRRLAQANADRHRPALATELNNLAASLGDLGRYRDGLAAATEAVRIRRALWHAGRRSALPDLLVSIGNAASCLHELGWPADVEPLFDDLLAGPGDDWAAGVVRLARAAWRARGDDQRGAVVDAVAAGELLRDDPDRQAAARRLLVRMRRAGASAFDAVWPADRELPAWLRHLDVPGPVMNAVQAWIDAGPATAAAVNSGAALLLTGEAEAHMQHLVDADPGDAGLRALRDLLSAARRDGVEVAFADYHTRVFGGRVAASLSRWTRATDLEQLRDVLHDEHPLLLDDEAEAQLEALLAADPGDATLLVRAGLLTLVRCDGIDAAFDLATGDQAGDRRLTDSTVLASGARNLALARLCAGRDPADADAVSRHAIVAMLAGRAVEAGTAMARCARLLPSWERRQLARRLTELAEVRPDLADGFAGLRAVLAR